MDKETFDFSFSGIKSQVHNFLDKLKKQNIAITEDIQKIIAYEFRESVIDVLNYKLIHAGDQFDTKSSIICGGVSANDTRFQNLQKLSDIPAYRPVKKLYSTDNAAMIGLVGLLKWIDNKK
ncbi:MAG: hypothetical protein GXP45_04545 [bacterium]|nr:hypothetical protein [bacterium]